MEKNKSFQFNCSIYERRLHRKLKITFFFDEIKIKLKSQLILIIERKSVFGPKLLVSLAISNWISDGLEAKRKKEKK